MATTRRTAGSAKTSDKSYDGFTDDERAAMKERAKELKAAGKKGKTTAAEDAQAVVDKIAELTGPDRELAERVHGIITGAAPELAPKLWYGMPAYAKDGKNVCFFQPASKFKARYATLGFNDPAQLDDGTMWPTSYALTFELSGEDEKTIAALVRKAVS
jgi:uncharacterized protein YdhG (YjbR/CyaY superfamily)